jgi:hypothetical protein
MARLKRKPHFGLVALLALGACTPTVRLDTPEPVRIDVNMKVDVTSHDAGTATDEESKENEVDLSPAQRQRNRMAEIQNLKNDRVAGERNDGLLEMRRQPTDPSYTDYARQLIENENKDRLLLLKAEAADSGRPLEAVRKEYADARRQSAFPGEWIQESDGVWKQR